MRTQSQYDWRQNPNDCTADPEPGPAAAVVLLVTPRDILRRGFEVSVPRTGTAV